MEDRKNEDTRHEVARNLFHDVEDGDQQDDFSEFIWNEIEASVNSAVNSTEACHGALLRKSPDPECAICLEAIENKGVADSCFHSFCFSCLLKWSKIRAECPLCKQPFSSILHNIRAIDNYDQYHIAPKNVSWRETPDFTSEFWTGRPTSYRGMEDSFECIAYEMIRASRLVTSPSERSVFSENPSTISFRRHVYENRLWVKPFRYDSVQHHRINFAEFYRRHPQYVSRLRPWLNRELFALLCDRLNQVPLVLDLILSLVARYDMRSEEFFFQVVPYFQHRTSHFVHEFFNFASSLYEMDIYDYCAIYENLVSETGHSAIPCTTRCDANPVASSTITFSENTPSVCIIYASGSSCLSGRNMASSFERQLECSSRSVKDNIWHSAFPVSSESLQHTSQNPSSSFQRFSDHEVFSGPSTSGMKTAAEGGHGNSFPNGSESVACFPADDDSDSSIVTLFPPELIDLVSSSSEDENVCLSNTDMSHMTTQTAESSACSFLEKELQAIKTFYRDTSDNMFQSSSSTNRRSLIPGPQCFGSPSLLDERVSPSIPSNCRSLTSGSQFPCSPSPFDEKILPSMPANRRSLTPGPWFLGSRSLLDESVSPSMLARCRSLTSGPQFPRSPSPFNEKILPSMRANRRSLTPGPQFLGSRSLLDESVSPSIPAYCRSLTPGPQFLRSPSVSDESISSSTPTNHRSSTPDPQFFGSPLLLDESVSPSMPAIHRILTPGPQFISPLSPHGESISPPMPVLTNRMNSERDNTFSGSKCIENSKLQPTCQSVMDPSTLLRNYIVTSHFPVTTDADSSETVCNSVKTCSACKHLPSRSGNDLPVSFSLSINQTFESDSGIAMNSSINQVPGFRLNDESQSSMQGRENNQKEYYERWQHCNQSAESSDEEERAVFKGSDTKRKLCSVVCVRPPSNHQSIHSRHSSSCHKRHKKKQKKHKHSHHHKCSHHSSACSHHLQKCKKHKDRKKKKHSSHKRCGHSQERPSQSDVN